MITKKEAINKVEKYLIKRNSDPNGYVFKIPVYKSWIKKLKKYYHEYKWKRKGIEPNRILIEFEVEPDFYKKYKLIEIILINHIKDLGICWSIPYCADLQKKTPHIRYASTGGGPIYVDKEDGKMYQTGSNPMVNWPNSFRAFKNGTKTEKFPNWKPIKE